MNSLLNLARETLTTYFDGIYPELSPEVKKELSKRQACFVTLTKNGKLRGATGSLEPRQELYKELMENAVNAAFHDPRFTPLKKEELSAIKIEVSILSVPRQLSFSDSFELLKFLTPGEDGVLIKKDYASATYLPQVWEDIPSKEEFLSSLCLKAGLDHNSWKKPGMKVFIYRAKVFREE